VGFGLVRVFLLLDGLGEGVDGMKEGYAYRRTRRMKRDVYRVVVFGSVSLPTAYWLGLKEDDILTGPPPRIRAVSPSLKLARLTACHAAATDSMQVATFTNEVGDDDINFRSSRIPVTIDWTLTRY
jgi:hypothetical protein